MFSQTLLNKVYLLIYGEPTCEFFSSINVDTHTNWVQKWNEKQKKYHTVGTISKSNIKIA